MHQERIIPAAAEAAKIEEYLARCRNDLELTDYWQSRGLTKEFAKRAGLGYDKQEKRLVIPTDTAYVARAVDNDEPMRYKNPKGIPVALTGAEELKTSGTVYVVEGALDALAIRQAGGRAVALNGISNAHQIVELAGAYNSPAHILLALDNDKPGHETSQKLEAALSDKGIDVQLALDAWEPCKDAGEWLEVGGRKVLERKLAEISPPKQETQTRASHSCEQPDDETYREMYERLKKYKPEHAKGDLLNYWKKVTDEIREATMHLHEAQHFCKVLSLWSMAIDQAAKEFDFKQDELSPIRDMLDEIGKKTEQEAEDWQDIFALAEWLDGFTRDLIDKAMTARKENPLLTLPEVQHAGSLGDLLAKMPDKISVQPDKHHDIYYAAVKEIIHSHQGIGIYEADREVVKVLNAQGMGSGNMAGILACSPRLEYLDKAQKTVDAQRFVQYESNCGKLKQGEEDKTR